MGYCAVFQTNCLKKPQNETKQKQEGREGGGERGAKGFLGGRGGGGGSVVKIHLGGYNCAT